MSAFLVLAAVSVVAFAAMRLSMNIFTRALDQFKQNSDAKKFIIKMAMIITPIIWVIVFFFPVDYGPVPRELKLWIMLWSMKTIGYFLAPAVVALLAAFYLQNKK